MESKNLSRHKGDNFQFFYCSVCKKDVSPISIIDRRFDNYSSIFNYGDIFGWMMSLCLFRRKDGGSKINQLLQITSPTEHKSCVTRSKQDHFCSLDHMEVMNLEAAGSLGPSN